MPKISGPIESVGQGTDRMELAPNGSPCFFGRHCLSRNCSACPLALRCGLPIGNPCNENIECCSLNCVENVCQHEEGISSHLWVRVYRGKIGNLALLALWQNKRNNRCFIYFH